MATYTALPAKVAMARSRLVGLIAGLNEGDALPPERVLAQRWRVSRMTLRRASDDLVADGVVERRPGSGTFISRPRLMRRLSMTSFTEDMLRRGRTPSSVPLHFRRRKADRAIARQLRIPMGELVIEFSRLRLADAEPMAIEYTLIAEAAVPGLSQADLHGSWYLLLSEQFGIHIEAADMTIYPILPEPKQAARLEIPADQPCLCQRADSMDRTGRLWLVSETIYRGDTYSLSIQLGADQRSKPIHKEMQL